MRLRFSSPTLGTIPPVYPLIVADLSPFLFLLEDNGIFIHNSHPFKSLLRFILKDALAISLNISYNNVMLFVILPFPRKPVDYKEYSVTGP